ncbi:DNA-processing protein DprA [Nocardiopsis baichengensis]|uniref:DNA-processing protein DprA n=1 Tax=Nocardiopsis baichengensis TaxID=280240 RepID=UPI000594157B|nr:DNA-processing protein DprA [Nocardiopsis baichengensis]
MEGEGQSSELESLFTLLLRERTGWAGITERVLDAGSASAVLHEASDSSLFEVEDDRTTTTVDEARALLQWCSDEGIDVRGFWQDGYPSALREIHEMPPAVFSKGTLCDDRRAIAVVGSRKASPRGLQVASNIAAQLAQRDITVVSGLAAGIDAAAHRAALENSGRTVAVIGTGIDRYYPAANRALQQEIAARGLVLSQFLPGSPPTRQTFPMRNAVMSGYAAATVVVEAGEHSGARIQARMALKHGRQVIFTESLLANRWAAEYAERPGVHVVSGLRELSSVAERIVAEASSTADDMAGEGELVW